MLTIRRIKYPLSLAFAAALLTILLAPGSSHSTFNVGQDPIIEEGWAQTAAASAAANECASAQEACVEWCRIIDGEPRPLAGALCCVEISRLANDNFGDCLQRIN